MKCLKVILKQPASQASGVREGALPGTFTLHSGDYLCTVFTLVLFGTRMKYPQHVTLPTFI